jgi:anti-sigma regulatory factor (Ser/Thr protein kinase)
METWLKGTRFLALHGGYRATKGHLPHSSRGDVMPVWSRGFPRTFEAAREARSFLRGVLSSRIPPQVLDDVTLMTSELAMNGVRHVSAAEGDWLEVSVEYGDDVLKVSVRDPGTDFAREDEVIPRGGQTGGWGLPIVNGLSSRWGVAPDAGGTTVWFEVDQPMRGE